MLDTHATTVIEGTGEPLVVDWKPHQRGDLEVAMKEGVAVVAYDSHGLKLLRDCHVDGNYGFIGMTIKQQLVRLESADEVRANLPLSGALLASRFGGEMSRGLTVDIAMVMVGKVRTTWRNVTFSDLKGACSGATHFVRGATVGAFAMDTGSRAQARAVAELFGAGVSGGGANQRAVHNEDGSLGDCGKSQPDAQRAPSQCGALLRLELSPVEKKADKPVEAQATRADVEATCPAGMRMVDGKCSRAQAGAASSATCEYGTRECIHACAERGDAESCLKLGVMAYQGDLVPKSMDTAAGAFMKACEKGNAKGCTLLGDVIANTKKDYALVAKLWTKACNDGEENACAGLGALHLMGAGIEKDAKKASNLLFRGCEGGNRDACSNLGMLYLGGNGMAKDLGVATKLFKLACDGDSAVGCSNYGYMVEFGKGGTDKDASKATLGYAKACRLDQRSCLWLGVAKQLGKGTPKDDDGAMTLFKTSCKEGQPTACALLKAYVDPSTKIDPEELKRLGQIFLGTCKEGSERDCTQVAIYAMALGSKDDGADVLKVACKAGDDWACLLQKYQIKAP